MRRFVLGAALTIALQGVNIAPAHASQIALNLSGTLDLPPFGSQATPFEMSVAWDSGALPTSLGVFTASYPFTTVGFSLDGTDYSSEILSSQLIIGHAILVDEIHVSLIFNPLGVPVGLLDYLFTFSASLQAPIGSFPLTPVPGDLAFLNLVTNTDARAFTLNQSFAGGTVTSIAGSVVDASVPEPASLTLLTLGVGGLVGRRWRRRSE
jgi:hypothetical protein